MSADLVVDQRPCPGEPRAIEVVARGQMTLSGVAAFKHAVDAAVAGPPCILLVGLQGVPFLPSITLSYLADLVVRLERRGGAIAFVQADPKVKYVLAQLGLVQFFHFFDDFEAAGKFAAARARELSHKPRLLVGRGPGEGQEYPIGDQPVLVGSDPEAMIHVRAPFVEPKHAEISGTPEGYVVRHLAAKGSTFVGSKKIAAHVLAEGDVIRIGEFELRFLEPGGD